MNIIYKVISGSRLYGTDTPESDYDYRGVWLPTLEESLSMKSLKDYKKDVGIFDVMYYPLQKFIRLLVSGNPNVLDWLFVPEDNIRSISSEMKTILLGRKHFIGKHIIPKIFGYARGEYECVAKKSNRKTGAKRRKEMEKFGYSPKSAMNAIRVLQQGAELITSGHITYPRPNSEELLRIKTGETKEKDLDGIYQEALSAMRVAEKTCTLPDGPDINAIESMVFDILTRDLRKNIDAPQNINPTLLGDPND